MWAAVALASDVFGENRVFPMAIRIGVRNANSTFSIPSAGRRICNLVQTTDAALVRQYSGAISANQLSQTSTRKMNICATALTALSAKQ
jgi:hypothetical protein